MYLVDTNVWLERLLDQERSEDVRRFLAAKASERLFITDFTLHSIGVVLIRLNKMEGLLRFVRDAFLDGAVALIHLEPGDTEYIVRVAERFNLDFDDAYQYTAAEKYDLTLVSFDSDFDRTERGRKTPAEVLQG
jgi:predicted nucleic acid-binding protein